MSQPLPARAPRSIVSRLVRGGIAILVVVYALIVAALWHWQASFIFLPDPEVGTTPADVGATFEKVSLPMGADRLTGWWIPVDDPQAGALLYLHGNASNIGANARDAVGLRRTGLNVFIIDYRGYGESTGGPPRERLVYEDAQRAWTYLVDERHIAPTHIAIYGHSLGGAAAVELATRHPDAGAVIADSTLLSVIDTASRVAGWARPLPLRLIVTERLDARSMIRSVRVPALILSGTEDRMVTPEVARTLYAAANEPKQLVTIPGAGHEDAAEVNPEAYYGAITGFLAQHRVTSGPQPK